MLKSITGIFTTATAAGVTTRYWITIITAVIATIGALGFLSPEQQEALTKQVPILVTALAGLIPVVISTYAIISKSSSDKAAEAAKRIDAIVPVSAPVVIQTPPGLDNIIVPAS